jgi:hypothetical protein
MNNGTFRSINLGKGSLLPFELMLKTTGFTWTMKQPIF